jgi:hypothetical protein
MSEENPADATYWKKCNLCKKEIPFEGIYYLCSVSTCRSKRVGLVFCSSSCWDDHLSFAPHRNAYAEEETAPSKKEYLQSLKNSEGKKQ